MLEKLSNEPAAGIRAFGGMAGEVSRAPQSQRLAVGRLVLGGGVDGFPSVLQAEPPGRVELFQAEAQRVDGRVAGHALRFFGQLSHLLAHGQRRIKSVVHELNGHRRWFKKTAEHLASEEDAPVDW